MSFLRLPALAVLVVLVLPLISRAADAEGGRWTTIFFKRTFVGTYNVKNDEGGGTTVRMPVTIPLKASKIRIWLRSDREKPAAVARISLVQASDIKGAVSGKLIPVLFSAAPAVTLAAGQKDAASDITGAALTPGRWYLDTLYTSEKCLYTYDAEGGFTARA